MFNPFANMTQTMQQLNEFRQNYQGNNPKGQVQSMLNSGQISQDQFNSVMPIAQQLYQMIRGGR